MIITFPSDKVDLILNSFYENPELIKDNGKPLAQLYMISSKNEKINNSLNKIILMLTPEEQITFISDFLQEYSPSQDAYILFQPILSEQFLTLPFLNTIYNRPDIFIKIIRCQSLRNISPDAFDNFINILKYDIENFSNYDILNPAKTNLKVARFPSIMELIFNVYSYTKKNLHYQNFIKILPNYEILTERTVLAGFQYSLTLCLLHKEIVKDKSNPYLENCSAQSQYLRNNPNMYFATIFFCISKEYNDGIFHQLKVGLLNTIMEWNHFNDEQVTETHQILYDFFIENGNEVAKEFLVKYSISRDKLGD